jgi:phosphatidylinositol alpha-1,6-mannosyltransferase
MLNRKTPDGDVEGFGMVFLEAGACGRPVVGGASGGAVEAVRHGVTGYLVPEGDGAAAVRALVSLLRDPESRERMGEVGRRFAARHAWERRAQRVQAICALLRARHRKATAPRGRLVEWPP